jgi:hypothetical protein
MCAKVTEADGEVPLADLQVWRSALERRARPMEDQACVERLVYGLDRQGVSQPGVSMPGLPFGSSFSRSAGPAAPYALPIPCIGGAQGKSQCRRLPDRLEEEFTTRRVDLSPPLVMAAAAFRRETESRTG